MDHAKKLAYVPAEVHEIINNLTDDKYQKLIAAHQYNSHPYQEEGRTVTLFPVHTWRRLTSTNTGMIAKLEDFCYKFNNSLYRHTFTFNSDSNKVSRLGREFYHTHLSQALKKSILNRSPKFHVNTKILYQKELSNIPSLCEDQRQIKLYLNSREEHLYELNKEALNLHINSFSQEELSHINQMLTKPYYTTSETTFRIHDPSWSSAPKKIRSLLLTHMVELDLQYSYLAIIEFLCRKYKIECSYISGLLSSNVGDIWDYLLQVISDDYYNGKSMHGIKLLSNSTYSPIKKLYLETNPTKGILTYPREDQPRYEYVMGIENIGKMKETGFLENWYYEEESDQVLSVRSVRDVLKVSVYRELFGSSRQGLLQYLLSNLDPIRALAIYGSSFMYELGRIERTLENVALSTGLRDAYGTLHKADRKCARKRPSAVIHAVCSSYELALLVPAYKTAQKMPSLGQIALHQHDGVAVVGSQEFYQELIKAVDSYAKKQDIRTRLIVKRLA